jgi:deoxyribonuclease-4
MKAKFGVGGFPPAFYQTDYRRASFGKRREGIFPWLHSLNLDWLELECTYGVKMPDDQAREYRYQSEMHGIGLSIHAPYYCVLASRKPETIKRSKEDLIACFDLARILGVKRIIFHPGYPANNEKREESLDMIVSALLEIEKFRPEGLMIYPEIGGKKKQLGDLDEIIYICQQVDYARPCLDLAHLNAREDGSLTSAEAIKRVLCQVEKVLGREKLEQSHFHVYPAAHDKHGEKEHLAFPGTLYVPGAWVKNRSELENQTVAPSDDNIFPRADHFIEAIHCKGLKPTVVCEARNSQEQGAMLMKRLFDKK